jgi:hypothetical protein
VTFSGDAFFPIIFAGFAISAALACIPASIASNKGRSFAGFWLFGLFALVIAIAVALLISDESRPRGSGRVPCPRCAELVAAGAHVCRFCGAQFEQPIGVAAPGVRT